MRILRGMQRFRSICLVNVHTGIADALRETGREVLALHPKPGVVDLPALLREHCCTPDLLVQGETLGERILLSGLPEVGCIKIFWSIDTHLNLYWHSLYGRLFDGVAATQRRLLPELRREGLGAVGWLPWFGVRREFVPWERREADVAFVGRVTEQRPVRKFFAEFLRERFDADLRQDLTYAGMLDVYAHARLAPNEAIAGEVNFRLFEAASCGGLCVTPDVSDEIADLFEPGLEVELFGDALELAERLAFLRDHPSLAGKMALAAHERIAREHLPEHRARSLLDFAASLEPQASDGAGADRAAFAMTLLTLWEAGRLDIAEAGRDFLLRALPLGPEGMALRLRLAAVSGGTGDASRLAAVVDAEQTREDAGTMPVDERLGAGCSVAALRAGEWDMAKRFWYRHAAAARLSRPEKPEDGPHLCRLWARELSRSGRLSRSGFAYEDGRHLPVSAAECLAEALRLDSEDLETHRQFEVLTRKVPGAEFVRLGLLSHLTLHERENWRLGLELGLLDLKIFRVEAGLEELRNAAVVAERAGRGSAFARALELRDRRGVIARALGG